MTDRELIDELINAQVSINIAMTTALIELWPSVTNQKYLDSLNTIQEQTRRLIELMKVPHG